MSYFFFFLSCLCLSCTTLVIGIQNPIHSILLLIVVFASGSILLIMLNIEFFALIFLIVYVGAIMVLFLFIVMMLDIKMTNISQKLKDFFSYRALFLAFLLIEILFFTNEDMINFNSLLVSSDILQDNIYTNEYFSYSNILKYTSHLEALGKSLFTHYVFSFLLSGFILFIAMLGAIVVTVDDSLFKKIKQQNANLQALRSSNNAILNFRIISQKK